MPATVETLCGITSVAAGEYVIFVAQGMPVGSPIRLAEKVEEVSELNPVVGWNIYTSPFATVPASGNIVFPLTSFTTEEQPPFTWPKYFFPPIYGLFSADDPGAQEGGDVQIDWTGGVPAYITAPPVLLSATPGDTVVDLEWSAAVTCDALAEVIYTVLRSTSSPPTNGPSAGGATSYHDTGRTNGTTYYYRVRTRLNVLGNIQTGIYEELSNILAATPTSAAMAASLEILIPLH